MKHLKLTLGVILTFLMFTGATAQDFATTKGDMILDFGIGIGGPTHNAYNNWNNTSDYKVKIPTSTIVLQKAFWDDITIGGFAGMNRYGSNSSTSGSNQWASWSDTYNVHETNYYLGARGEYHFNRLIGLESKFDVYAGVMVGTRIWKTKWSQEHNVDHSQPGQSESWETSDSENGIDAISGLFIGGRYYFTQGMGVYAELGWAITPMRVGLAWRF